MEHFSLDLFQPKKKNTHTHTHNLKAFKRIMLKEPDLHLINFELETMIARF